MATEIFEAQIQALLDLGVDRGFSEAASAAGFLVWADPSLHVYHGDQ